ncbi:MAG: nucleoside hydrolase [Kiritimatiellales bacterium]|nr:nucleoside hydrolase [Kiritimatiellales bacterium]
MNFPKIDDTVRLQRLRLPQGKLRMVLDTDAYNEIDDQFAIVYSLLSPDRLSVEALYAAPFSNVRANDPSEGMEKSYDEILQLLRRLNVSPDGFVFRGSTGYLPDKNTPCESEAARDLVKKAMSSEEPLYVVAIGAITNVASAVLMEPEIINRIVVVWLGGNALNWPNNWEFNFQQDVPAAKIIFDCGVPLIHIPCMGVTTHLRTTVPEMELNVKGRGAIGNYLFDAFRNYTDNPFGWSKEIWDVAAIACLIDESWTPSHLVHSPVVNGTNPWGTDHGRHLIRSAFFIHRDPIFRDLFRKLEAHAERKDA